MILEALSLLTKVPKLIKSITSGNKSLAEKAISIAKAVTGQKDEEHAVQALKASPELALKYELALLNDKHIPDQMDLENTMDARDMYKKSNHDRADAIAERVMNLNPWLIVGLVILNVAVVKYIEESALIAIASNFIGMAMKELMSQMQTVINFFFGSSMGSKNKDK
jgi:hypothetical protein